MLERIFDFFLKAKAAAAKQSQREALLDLLVLGMFIDRHVANAEGQFIREQALGLEWEAVRSMESFIDASMRRARDVMGSENATGAYLEDIALRLATDEAKQKALQVCEELMTADGQLAEREQELLTQVKEQLGG